MPKPIVLAALLCDRVLIEADGSVSIIRIADKLIYGKPPQMPEGITPMGQVQFFMALRSGELEGTFPMKLFLLQPNAERNLIAEASLRLAGLDQGQNVTVPINVPIHQDGMNWVEVEFNGEVLTTIPVMVIEARPPMDELKSNEPADSPREPE